MPPSRLVVPVKYSSTRSCASPSASKTCAPVYEAMVEMPILLITLSTPLPAALTYFCTASRRSTPGRRAGVDEVLDRLEREVGVDGRGAVADQQRDVVDLTGVAGLDDQTDAGAGLLADEVVVAPRR
jgi:hypothetical protein